MHGQANIKAYILIWFSFKMLPVLFPSDLFLHPLNEYSNLLRNVAQCYKSDTLRYPEDCTVDTNIHENLKTQTYPIFCRAVSYKSLTGS